MPPGKLAAKGSPSGVTSAAPCTSVVPLTKFCKTMLSFSALIAMIIILRDFELESGYESQVNTELNKLFFTCINRVSFILKA
jgi:hypothetical protein